ncbi:M24 family metallopeptidase [Candidatus Woesearchaeota archaeon]|nr:M24 family metallopeptidase [Candidatus Woesearchaeota archaeon]
MKLKEFKRNLNSRGIDAAALFNISFTTSDPSIKYFTGSSCEHATLIIPKSKRDTLYLPPMELAGAKTSINAKPLTKEFHELFKGIKTKNLGVNRKKIPEYYTARIRKETGAKISDVSKSIIELRKKKTQHEMENITNACKETDRILTEVYSEMSKKKIRTESELAGRILYHMSSRGYQPSFPPIVANRKNGGKPHHTPTTQRIRKGFCYIDFGLWNKGYTSDITRTIYFGKPSKKEKEIYDKVLHAQEEAISAVRPGIMARQVDAAARESLGSLAKHFLHGLGHGIGVEVHERPYLNEKSLEIIENGQAFTIEPGIYTKRYGIRIEDDILVHSRAKILTKAPKELLCFPI